MYLLAPSRGTSSPPAPRLLPRASTCSRSPMPAYASGGGRMHGAVCVAPKANRAVRRGCCIAAAALLVLPACGSSSKGPGPAGRSRTAGATAPSSAVEGGSSAVATATASASAETVTASADGVTATMRGSTHHPRVGRWPVHFTVTSSGRPARAALSYEFLLGGQVVAHRSHYLFTGSFSDHIEWPAEAVGYPLTLRAVITAGRAVLNLDYPVQVSR